jgi:superoxide dismutase, Fe-Mn family
MNKRSFLKTIGLTSAFAAVGFKNALATETTDLPITPGNLHPLAGEFTLAPLPYAPDALEPAIDKQTMEIHHDRHHKAYVDNLNKAITANPGFANMSLEAIFKKLRTKDDAMLRNHGGGHWNHTFFWESLSPNKNQQPGEKTAAGLTAAFGSFDNFKTGFTKAATGQFGSGWAWLCAAKDKTLFITSTPNQDNPLMTRIADKTGTPLLGIDVWEHAYYLKYQNKRADYINAFYSIANWAKVEERLAAV